MSNEGDTPELAKAASGGLGKARLEALTDGIFSVAMTLLVLDIKISADDNIQTDAHLMQHLIEVERTFSVYLVSFIVLGMYWVAHSLQFHYIKRVDRSMLWISLIFMLLVTLVPFTTSLMITYETLLVPVVLYGINQALLATMLIVNINYLSRHMDFATAEFTPEVSGFIHRRLFMFTLVPLLAVAVAFLNTRASLNVYLLMLVLHFFPRHIDDRVIRWLRRAGR